MAREPAGKTRRVNTAAAARYTRFSASRISFTLS
jgi:hypothetical protein